MGYTGPMSFWTWLGLGESRATDEPDGLDAIEKALTGLTRARARYIACFAYILTRSARADHDVTEAEIREMVRLVAERAGIPIEQASVVVRLARAQAQRSGGTDDFVVTREFDRLASHEEKLALVDGLFAVSSVDESIVTVEDNEIRRIANELKIEHSEYIDIRARHLQHLAVLRGKPPEPS